MSQFLDGQFSKINSTVIHNISVPLTSSNISDQNEEFDYASIPATLFYLISMILLLFLCFTIGFITELRDGRPQRQMVKFIFLNHCLLALSSFLIFIILYHGDTVKSKIGCTVASMLLHYTILLTLLWNGCEVLGGYFVYIKLIGLDFCGYRWKMLGFNLVVALVPVVILVSINIEQYCTYINGLCWFGLNVLYFGILLPSSIIIAIATVIFIYTVIRFCQYTSSTTQGRRTKQRTIKRLEKIYSSMVLYVLAWVCAVCCQATQYRLVFYYLMSVTVLLYGGLMFKRSLDKLSKSYWKSILNRNDANSPV